MEMKISLNSVYVPSEDVVAREVQGEFIVIPITKSVSNFKDEIYSLNECGKAIWKKLDGKRSLKKVVDCLSEEFDASRETIEGDVLGLAKELLKRKMLIKV